jgi:hypothetical protein
MTALAVGHTLLIQKFHIKLVPELIVTVTFPISKSYRAESVPHILT